MLHWTHALCTAAEVGLGQQQEAGAWGSPELRQELSPTGIAMKGLDLHGNAPPEPLLGTAPAPEGDPQGRHTTTRANIP